VTGHDGARAGLAAAAAVPDLLEMLPETAALVALGRIGAAAGSAVPALEALLDDPAYRVQVGAVVALHRIGAGPGLLLPVLARHLDGDNVYAASSAAGALAELDHRLADKPELQLADLAGETLLQPADAVPDSHFGSWVVCTEVPEPFEVVAFVPSQWTWHSLSHRGASTGCLSRPDSR
jgi:hypothetical protein